MNTFSPLIRFSRASHTVAIIAACLCALAGQLPAQNTNHASIFRAVGVSWDTSDSKLYQVQSSLDRQGWQPATGVISGTGTSNTLFFPSSNPEQYFRVIDVPGVATNRFQGLQELLLASASVTAAGNSLLMSNLRVRSSGISLEDSVKASFIFDPASQSFKLNSYAVSPGVGVFNDIFFAKDNITPILLRLGDQSFPEGQPINANTDGTEEVFADLTIAHAPVLEFGSPDDVFTLFIKGPDGELPPMIVPASLSSFRAPLPILQSGRYVFSFRPNNKPKVKFTFAFHNANSAIQADLKDGDLFDRSFSRNWQYAKARVMLKVNESLFLPQPSSPKARLVLLNEKSQNVAQYDGLPLNYRATATGVYYLFLGSIDGSPVRYTGRISIKPL